METALQLLLTSPTRLESDSHFSCSRTVHFLWLKAGINSKQNQKYSKSRFTAARYMREMARQTRGYLLEGRCLVQRSAKCLVGIKAIAELLQVSGHAQFTLLHDWKR